MSRRNWSISQRLNNITNRAETRFRRSKLFSFPRIIQLESTNRCNLSCKECTRPYNLEKLELGDLTFDNFLRIMDNFKHSEEVHLSGLGEPLLNKDLFRMIRFLSEKGIHAAFNTNGLLLSDTVIDEIIDSGANFVLVTLDAATSETYRLLRGGNDFERILNNVKKLVVQSREARSKTIVSICFVIMRENMSELEKFVELGNDLKVSQVKFCDLSLLWPDSKRYAELEIKDVKGLRNNFARAERRARQLDIPISYARLNFKAWPAKKYRLKCWYLWTHPNITWDGYVTPCCAHPYPKVFNLGNILREDFMSIWNSPKYCWLRNLLASGEPHAMCRYCHHY